MVLRVASGSGGIPNQSDARLATILMMRYTSKLIPRTEAKAQGTLTYSAKRIQVRPVGTPRKKYIGYSK
jgi:hypothetical protein